MRTDTPIIELIHRFTHATNCFSTAKPQFLVTIEPELTPVMPCRLAVFGHGLGQAPRGRTLLGRGHPCSDLFSHFIRWCPRACVRVRHTLSVARCVDHIRKNRQDGAILGQSAPFGAASNSTAQNSGTRNIHHCYKQKTMAVYGRSDIRKYNASFDASSLT